MRVLALDGGGARGLLQAKYLVAIEEQLNLLSKTKNLPIGAFFDLVVGTSVGGISALAIADGMHAEAIYRFLDGSLSRVFALRRFGELLSYLRPKYSSGELAAALQARFGDRTMSSLGEPNTLGPHVCVVAHNPGKRGTRLFKSAYRSRFESLANQLRVCDAALATSAAPTYFPAASISLPMEAGALLDGGLVANNPSVIALLEASKLLEEVATGSGSYSSGIASRIQSVKLLSIGTGRVQWNSGKAGAGLMSAGKLWWSKRLHDQVLEAQADFAQYVTKRLCPSQNYVRINQQLDRECYLDAVKDVKEVIRDVRLTHEQEQSLKAWFDEGWKRSLFRERSDAR